VDSENFQAHNNVLAFEIGLLWEQAQQLLLLGLNEP